MLLRMLPISILFLATFWADVVYANDTESEIREVMLGYEKAWSQHDAKAIANYYHEPAMRVSKTGPAVRPTIKSQEIFFEGLLSSLIVGGYDSSAWESLNIHLMDNQTAIASGVTLRYKKDSTLIERTGVSYGLWKTLAGWKIFWSATHTPEGVLNK